ncbi:chain-length determining protein [Sphingomonas sanguinis]|uniref:Chain-length determining protein n=1 Tax=Sphingomonas sanguinis TaxID=33051 RepID=A0ABU5LRI6_9SPHN|nr:XrtA system polysaccharide chain length determinant [Sphingomonas sanguinis]MDZ7282552.1 chain-length determining protein [Sphingomonas sanguinis]QXT36689.1 chain-length determining protein [Sphingomonas sanguinis]
MSSIQDEIRIAIHAIWIRRWLALAVAWTVCILGWLFVAQIPSKYESRARIAVQNSQLLPDGMATGPNSQMDSVDQVRQTLISAINLQKVVRGTDLASTVSSDADVAARVAQLAQAIKIENQQDTIFQLTVTQSSPKLAQQVAQKLIDIFVESNLLGDRNNTSQSLAFLDKQLNERQKQLQMAEAKRAQYLNQFAGGLPGSGSVADRIGLARSQMAQVDSDLAAAQSSFAAVQGQLAGTPRTVSEGGGVAVSPARARLAAIQGQLADARARGYTENHPDVIALKNQLGAAQAAVRAEPAGGGPGGQPNPLYMSLQSMAAEKQSQLASLKIRKSQLQNDLDRLNASLATDPEAAAAQGAIDRDYQVLKDSYDQLLRQREQVALRGQAQNQTDSMRFSVIDPPTYPRAPTAPNRLLLLSVVFAAGLGLGVGAAFALSKLRQTFTTPQSLQRSLGMPVIGAIGEVVTRGQAKARAQRMKLFLGGTAALGGAYGLVLAIELLQRGMAA